MALIKGQTWLLLDWGLRLLIKVDQADFLAEMISRFLISSAFFQSNLFSDERGDLRQAFSALLADETAAWQSFYHHGRRGSLRDSGEGFEIEKFMWLADKMEFLKESYICLGSDKTWKEDEVRQFSRSAFHLGHLALKKIHDGGLEDRWMGSAFSVVKIGRWSLQQEGPRLMLEFKTNWDEVIKRSMVEDLPELGSIQVPKSRGEWEKRRSDRWWRYWLSDQLCWLWGKIPKVDGGR